MRSMAMPSLSHQTESFERLNRALGLAKGTPLSERMLLVVELDGPTMIARIGAMRALNRHGERVFNPDRKDKHWGKRKLKRDQK
jgi:hypothetical protein